VPALAPAGAARRRLAVLGSPIEHSLSPTLHARAYEILGVPFDYERVEVRSGELEAFLTGLDESWLGLSLTMPLKREIIPLLDAASPLVETLGVANTVVFSAGVAGDDEARRLAGHNTDVDGITRSIEALRLADSTASFAEGRSALLGGGATAASALVAAEALGIRSITAYLRDPAKGADLTALAATLGLAFEIAPLTRLNDSPVFDFVISTLPGGAASSVEVTPASTGAVLLDVAYEPWPTALATRWATSGGSIASGLDMLVEQAIGQIRLFTGLPQSQPLADEASLRAALRVSVGLAPAAVSE
jgi:shikimate dehydrogenase